jgi:lysophospholipase L1-like esterase
MQKPEFNHKTYFIAGVLYSSLVFGIVAGAVIYKIGPARIGRALGLTSSQGVGVVEIPRDILDELNAHKAVAENVGDLMPQHEHDTILVQPDGELGYRLRPSVHLDVTVLNATGSLNLDPPLLHVPSNVSLSERTKKYIGDNSIIAVSYSTDGDGRRMTIPPVIAAKRILIVGDSVAFGVGVDDGDTAASQLQKILGIEVQVINAGVGGYDGEQAFRMAEVLSRTQKYSALIYIACQNDFMAHKSKDWNQVAKATLEHFKIIAERFDNRVIVFLETYLEYNVRDVLLTQGWEDSRINQTKRLRAYLPEYARSIGFLYADWSDLVNDYRRSLKSVFAPFALYVDHSHLSPMGNRLMAEKIAALLQTR